MIIGLNDWLDMDESYVLSSHALLEMTISELKTGSMFIYLQYSGGKY